LDWQLNATPRLIVGQWYGLEYQSYNHISDLSTGYSGIDEQDQNLLVETIIKTLQCLHILGSTLSLRLRLGLSQI
jgi:hypothetical protein